VRHEPGRAAIAVGERGNPDKTVMRGGDDGFRLAKVAV